jgi:hypothetical protein
MLKHQILCERAIEKKDEEDKRERSPVERLVKGHAYYVEWYDAVGVNCDWQHTEDDNTCILEAPVNKSIGWMHLFSGAAIKLVPHYATKDSQYCGDMIIPICAIKTITEIAL